MREIDCQIETNNAVLKGTACLPDGPSRQFAVVLLIHGSGPLDRDENIKMQKLNIFNTVAHHLAAHGFASVRYDKRGVGQSTGDFLSSGHLDLVNDAIAWFDALPDFDFCDPKRRFLLGHSEGCLIAPQVNIQRAEVAGLLLLAPFIQSLESILLEQARVVQSEVDSGTGFFYCFQRLMCSLLGQPVDNQKKLITKIKASTTDTMRFRLQKIEAKWFRELFTLSPPAIFKAVTAPMLLVAGEKDLQCDPDDAKQIAQVANVPTQWHVINNLTHILRFDQNAPTFDNYFEQMQQPVAQQVLVLVSDWLKNDPLFLKP